MRLLIVSQYFWPENFRINELARHMVKRGHEVTVLCGTPNYPSGRAFAGFGWFRRTRERWEGVDIVRVPQFLRGKATSLRLAANYLSYALTASIFGPWRCRGRFDAILIFQMSPATMGIPAVVMKHVKDAPILHWVQDLWPESLAAAGHVRKPWLLRPVDRMVRWLYHAAALLLVQSRAFRAHVEARGIDPARIRYFPNTAEDLYVPTSREQAHPALARVPAGFRVMFAGNLGTVQDLPTVIEAATLSRHQADIHWVIVGDGSMRAWVEQEVARRGLGGNVHLLGQFPVTDMPRMFAGADVMLVTLRRDPMIALTIPSKLQSYLACGKPVLGALDGEGAQVVRDAGAGICGPGEDPRALADSVLTLRAAGEESLREMGARGRRYFEANFANDMLLDRLDGWLAEVSGAGVRESA
jgi:colanic acid biosynthesis glycosyl transferase WcaI